MRAIRLRKIDEIVIACCQNEQDENSSQNHPAKPLMMGGPVLVDAQAPGFFLSPQRSLALRVSGLTCHQSIFPMWYGSASRRRNLIDMVVIISPYLFQRASQKLPKCR